VYVGDVIHLAAFRLRRNTRPITGGIVRTAAKDNSSKQVEQPFWWLYDSPSDNRCSLVNGHPDTFTFLTRD
jgi:hypothetical protein